MFFNKILNTWNQHYKKDISYNDRTNTLFTGLWRKFFIGLKTIKQPESLVLINTNPWYFGKLKRNLQCRYRLKRLVNNKKFNLMVWLDVGNNTGFGDIYSDDYILGFHIGIDLARKSQDKNYLKYETEIYKFREKQFLKIKSKHKKFDLLIVDSYGYVVFGIKDKDIHKINNTDIENLLFDLGRILNSIYEKFYMKKVDLRNEKREDKKLNDSDILRIVSYERVIERIHKKKQNLIIGMLRKRGFIAKPEHFNRIDIEVSKNGFNKFVIIELKICETSSQCIMQGLGQLYYYHNKYYKSKKNVKLILMGVFKVENHDADLLWYLKTNNPPIYFLSKLQNLYGEIESYLQ